MKRALSSLILLFLIAAPSASADGFREAEVRGVGPDDDLGFSVADAGWLQILISPTDLPAGRFDRVCGTFDSA